MDSTTSHNRVYANVDNGGFTDRWAEKPNPARSNKKRWLLWGGLAALVAVIVIAVAVGVSVSHNSSKSSSKSSSSSGSGSNSTKSDPNNPSSFKKDDRLKQSFWAMAYTPKGSQLPECGNSLADTITDIQLMSQLTKRLRLYGADCNQSAIVLEAIKQTKVDMTVYLGIYNVPTDDHAAYKRQKDVVLDAIKTYGTDHISGVTVGNEFMLNYLTANGATDPDSAIGDTGAAVLRADIDDFRTTLQGMNLPKTLTVGTAEAGSYFNKLVLQDVDYGMSNVHPWFAQTTAENAAGWTAEFFKGQNVEPAALLPNKPTMWIAETGWPTKSSDAAHATNGAAPASEGNLQIFLDTFVCQANTNGTGYFFFEMFDEDWKDKQFGGVEGWWGLFNQDKTLKNIKIPDCVI